MRGNPHVPCGPGEKLEIISKAYLSVLNALRRSGEFIALNDVFEFDELSTYEHGGKTYRRHPDFILIATMNPMDYTDLTEVQQSVRARFQKFIRMDNPTPSEVRRWIEGDTGWDGEPVFTEKIISVVQYLQSERINLGLHADVSNRQIGALFAALMYGDTLAVAFQECIINALSMVDEDVEKIIDELRLNTKYQEIISTPVWDMNG